MFKHYQYDKYEKVEFDLNTIDSAFMKSKIFKGMEFVFKQIDTSKISGKTFLPIFINETLSQVYGNNEAKKIEKNRNAGKSRLISNLSEKRLTFKSEIDIRGKRAEEAIQIIQEFIDEAIMFEVSQLRILHGKGNGILKEIIRSYLKAEPMVKSFKDEHVDFGGAGITVINLAL
jgi:DNA-nicking Smr family endonuclease